MKLGKAKKLSISMLLIVAVSIGLLSGCAAEKDTSSDFKIKKPEPLVLTDLNYNEIFKEDKVDLLELNFTFPQIENPDSNPIYEDINASYVKVFEEAKKKAAVDNLNAAKESYLLYKDEPELSFIMHGYHINYSVMTNDGRDLSIFQMFSDFSGGAHPNTYFYSQNYDVTTGKVISLTDILGKNEAETKQIILEQVLAMIKKQQASEGIMYYETYEEDCDKTYNPENFYLKDGKLIFFYQTYDIAPYAAGLREFEIQVK